MSQTLKSADKARERVKQILKDAHEREADYTARIDTADEATRKADEAMKEAMKENDFDSYAEAKARRQTAADAKEMAETGFAMVKAEPLITDDEYHSLNDEIMKEADQARQETKKKLLMLSKEMEKTGAEYKALCHDASRVLYQLQHDVYADADIKKTAAGSYAPSQRHGIRNAGGLIEWSRAAISSIGYKRAAGLDKSNHYYTGDDQIL